MSEWERPAPIPIERSSYCVFILGAGASVAWGAPLMKDFLDTAKERYFDLKRRSDVSDTMIECYESLFGFHRHYRDSLWAIDRDWDNIEELYTQADLVRLAQIPDEQTADHQCQNIAWTIWDVYRRCRKDALILKACATAQREFSPAIVTTNYDLVCECALSEPSAGCGYVYPGFPGISRIVRFDSGHTWMPSNHAVPIIKLHGSVNMFRAGNEVIADNGLQPFVRDDIMRDAICEEVLSRARPSENAKLVPLIIPPMLGKASQDAAIAMQWRAAIQVLARAQWVIVVGYSFPTTDTFMSRLLTEGLKGNDNLLRMVVIDVAPREQHGIMKFLGNTIRINRLHYFQLSAESGLGALNDIKSSHWLNALFARARTH